MYYICCILQFLEIISVQLDELINVDSGGNITVWSAGKDYVADDVVRKGNKYYKCILDHTSSGDNKPPNTTYWEAV